jgi:hypothetical protein
MKAILLARYPDFVKMVLATDDTPAELSDQKAEPKEKTKRLIVI